MGPKDLGSSWSLPFLSCVALGVLFNLSELQFSLLRDEANDPHC